MKLTVGRIVHAHRVVWRNGIAQESGAWAALVTHITLAYARIRIFWACPEFDIVAEVSLDEATIRDVDSGWLWRWPPRE